MEHRLAIVQYAGDFREASQRLAAGGPETYGSQRYTVDYVEGLASRLEAVTTITALTEERFDVVLPSGARAIGGGFSNKIDSRRLIDLVERASPNLLILRWPFRPLLRWAIKRKCRSLVLLADSFNPRDFTGRIRWWLLAHYLKQPVFDLVANHGRNASEQLVDVGVDARKVVAWDYPPINRPHDRPAKMAAGADNHLIYVGSLSESKGVTDLIAAVRLLTDQSERVKLSLAGVGRDEMVRTAIEKCGVADRVTLLGRVPHDRIVPMMAQADIVVVPSRHSYPEGLPLTIYEAFSSRTPVIASDHPMFVGNIVHEDLGLLFRTPDPSDLARQIARLLHDSALYARLSYNGLAAWERLQTPVTWATLIDHWLDDGPEARAWLRKHSLASAGS